MAQVHNVIVVTSCTNRKKQANPVLPFEDVEFALSLRDLARRWKSQVQSVDRSALSTAVDLYLGRSITEARRTAEALNAPLFIVSAGHGLLRADESIPSYNITVSPGAGNPLYQCLERLDKTPADWWHAIVQEFGKRRSLSALVARSRGATILLAVPSAYLTLLGGELAQLDAAEIARLRIITSTYGASGLQARLQPAVMPYDDRLEGLADYAGTRSDFPQRALRHFVAVLSGHGLQLDAARARVHEAMEALRKPVPPLRQRRTDEEITALLRQNWTRFSGSATLLLRFLRDEAMVSCEQSRFRLLRQRLVVEFAGEVP